MQAITAAEMLLAGGMDVDRVRHHLARVDPIQAKIRVAPGWFTLFWASGVVGVCMPWSIYVRPEIMQRYRSGDELVSIATLIAHELTHLEQYRRLGPIRHGIRYAADYVIGRLRKLGHWNAYRAIGLEREARYVAALITLESQS